MKHGAETGVSVALLTPFDDDGGIDTARLSSHASDMLLRGATSVTLFGTTGESASIGNHERVTGINAVRDAAVPADRVILGVCATAVNDVAAQVRQGLEFGIRNFLLPPPFYFSSVGDAGLFDWHVQVLRATAPETRFILYNIPQVTGVHVSPQLVARLGAACSDRIAAVKDSSGDWSNANTLLELATVPVLIGDERLLHRAVPLGCRGSITGIGNLFPERVCKILDSGQEDTALSRIVDRIVSGSVIPEMKALLANAKADPGWSRVRPPLSPVESATQSGHSTAERRELAHGRT